MTNKEIECQEKHATLDGQHCGRHGLDIIGAGLECARCRASGGTVVTAEQMLAATKEHAAALARNIGKVK